MGATSAMFGSAWHQHPKIDCVDWPSGEFATLRELAAAIVKRDGIDAHDSVGGSSLGGMVAQEIACISTCPGVVLLGSAESCEEIPRLLRWLAPLARGLPVEWAQFSAPIVGELGKQFAHSDPKFIRSMCSAAANWAGVELSCARLRIHGANDHIIPPPARAHLIEGAGHLVAMSHGAQCLALVDAWLRR